MPQPKPAVFTVVRAAETAGNQKPMHDVNASQPLPADGATSTAAARARSGFWAKALLDLTLILLTALAWLPLMLIVALWVKLSSPGPVFFRQRRIGYMGREFFIFKFRTMQVNADTACHERYFEQLIKADCPMTKLDARGDSRLIPGGAVLRASGLDELPQIFNVLQGNMSLVGPRPCTPHEFERYDGHQKERVNTPPGLTGYWQTHGKNSTTFSEMVAMDIYYARHASVGLDLAIIARTIPVLLGQLFESRRPSPAEVAPPRAVMAPARATQRLQP